MSIFILLRLSANGRYDLVPPLLISRRGLIFALKDFTAVILYSLVTCNISSPHSPLVAAIYVSRSS